MSEITLSIKNLIDVIKSQFYFKVSENGTFKICYEDSAIAITEKFFNSLYKNEIEKNQINGATIAFRLKDTLVDVNCEKLEKVVEKLKENGFIIISNTK